MGAFTLLTDSEKAECPHGTGPTSRTSTTRTRRRAKEEKDPSVARFYTRFHVSVPSYLVFRSRFVVHLYIRYRILVHGYLSV